jgi:preprotein translocase subunit SecE
VAGETRRQRRDARRAAGEDAARGSAPRAVPVGPQTPEPAVEHGRRGGFIRESIGELKKVEWPNRRQLFSATVAVILAVAVVGAYLWIADLAFARFVKDVLLNL